MPSPFPGMDPYLENPVLWPAVHHGLIFEMVGELNRQLRPRYYATMEERVYLSDEGDTGREFVVPDVHVVTHRHSPAARQEPDSGRVTTIKPLEVTTVILDEIREARVEIVDAQSRAVVTVIEMLSPTNKLKGSYGRESYQKKRPEVLSSTSHLVEVDLLRAGIRIYIREDTPAYDYLVHVSRAEGAHMRGAKVWPIPIHLPLPAIPIPLNAGDADILIDLQRLLGNVYEQCALDLRVDYRLDPIPALTAEQAAWAKSLTANRSEV